MSDTVAELSAITGLDHDAAENLLQATGGDLATAVELHFEQDDSARSSARDAALAASVAAEEYGDDVGDEYDDEDGEDGFPDAEDEPGGGPPPLQPGPRRAVRSPEPHGEGGAAMAPHYPRLGALYRWAAAYLPFFGVAERIGRFTYRTGIVGFLGTLLWAPLALIGLVGPGGGRRGGPAGPVRPFGEWFEEFHGTTHPRFFGGSCQSALSRSRADAKFLLAYLHDHGAPECEQFCSQVLASALFAAFADENFIVWVGELHTPEGRAVRRALRVS